MIHKEAGESLMTTHHVPFGQITLMAEALANIKSIEPLRLSQQEDRMKRN